MRDIVWCYDNIGQVKKLKAMFVSLSGSAFFWYCHFFTLELIFTVALLHAAGINIKTLAKSLSEVLRLCLQIGDLFSF